MNANGIPLALLSRDQKNGRKERREEGNNEEEEKTTGCAGNAVKAGAWLAKRIEMYACL